MPVGRILEVFGFEGTGKTTLAAEFVKAFQNDDRSRAAVYLDYEHAVDQLYFKKMGVNIDKKRFVFLQPNHLEAGADAAILLVKTGKVSVLVIDSVASMTPKAELEGSVEDYSMGLQARKMGQFLRKIGGLLSKKRCTAIFINQLRDKIGNPFLTKFDPTTTPGGRALKFYSSIRIELKFGKEGKRRIKIKKQKTCAYQGGITEFKIGPNGINARAHRLECFSNLGLVKKRNNIYHVGTTAFSNTAKLDEELQKPAMFKAYMNKLVENEETDAWEDNG